MSNFKLKIIAASVLTIIGFTASNDLNATVTVYKNHESRMLNQEAQFSQNGISGEVAAKIRGYGKDIPFNVSLDILVPKHWDISYNEGAETLLVNWASTEDGLAWPYILEDLSKKNNISVNIDWTRKSVDFFAHNIGNIYFKELETLKSTTPETVSERIAVENILRENEEKAKNNAMLQKLIEEQNAALQEKQKEIASLIAREEEIKKQVELEREKLIQLAENDTNKVVSVENGNAVIQVETLINNPLPIQLSEEDLKRDYDSKFVLPLNSTFQFYKDGGWQQTFDFFTPATYLAKRGLTIQEILEQWATSIGWELAYETNVHYTLDFDVRFEGIARESFISLISLYEDAQRPLDVHFYVQQKLIVIKDLSFKIKN